MFIFLSRCLISIPVILTHGCLLKCLHSPVITKPTLFPLARLLLLKEQTENLTEHWPYLCQKPLHCHKSLTGKAMPIFTHFPKILNCNVLDQSPNCSIQCFLWDGCCSFSSSLLYLLTTNFEQERGKRSIGDPSMVCMGLVLLEMHIGAAARESQYVNVVHISLDLFFSISIEISYVYCLLYLPLHEAKILNLRKFHAKEK